MIKCVIFDIDEHSGAEINHIWLVEERPEKIYCDHVDHYGDIRDSWRVVKIGEE